MVIVKSNLSGIMYRKSLVYIKSFFAHFPYVFIIESGLFVPVRHRNDGGRDLAKGVFSIAGPVFQARMSCYKVRHGRTAAAFATI